jgi:hypothetical protein
MDQLLDIDVRLLVLRYGRQRVLAALARLVEQTPEQLEQELQALDREPAGGRRKQPKPSLIEIAASECRDRADILEPIKSLAIAFENRSFLPNLRDAQRFLDRAGSAPPKLKSRAAAGPLVIHVLSTLPKDELNSLAERNVPGGESDYALLARAIMGARPGQEEDRG